MPGKPANLKGKVFYDLTFIKYLHSTKDHRAIWLAKCSCGKVIEVIARNVKKGDRKNCGDLIHFSKGGETSHPLYGRWELIIKRCYDPTFEAYKYYGARNIGVDDLWRTFQGFLTWKEIPKLLKNPELQIGRINNYLGYSPENCQLQTNRFNSNSKRKHRKHLYKGKYGTLRQICQQEGITDEKHFEMIRQRISRGWRIEEAIKIPKLKNQYKAVEVQEIRDQFTQGDK